MLNMKCKLLLFQKSGHSIILCHDNVFHIALVNLSWGNSEEKNVVRLVDLRSLQSSGLVLSYRYDETERSGCSETYLQNTGKEFLIT